MEINPFSNIATTVTLTPGTSSLPEIRNWQTGQILEAIATSQLSNGQVKLQIGSLQFTAKIPFSVEPGQKLALEVVKLADSPVLQLAQTDSNKNAIINAALRSVLAKQVPGLPPLLSNITYISNQPAQQQSTAFPPAVLLLAKTFFNLLPEAKQISTPEGLQRAIKNSGIFFENKLARQATGSRNLALDIPQDFKAGLLKLRQAIQALSNKRTSSAQQTSNGNRNSGIQLTEKPVADKSSTSKPLNERPPASRPFTDKPLAGKPATEKLLNERSPSDRLLTEKSFTEKPVTEKPLNTKLTTDKLFTEKSFTGKPVSEKFISNKPVSVQSITDKLIRNKAVSGQSIIDTPSTKIPLSTKTLTRTFANKKSDPNTDKQQAVKVINSETTDKKTLELAKKISDQFRNATKAIRNALMRPSQNITNQSLASNIRNAPDSGSLLSGTLTPKRISLPNLDSILTAIKSAEDLPYMKIKKGMLQTQARVSATINQQSLLEQIIATLFKDVESSLARIQLHQLTSQTQETDTKQVWMMELPVRKEDGTDVFHLHIERDANKNGSTDPENKSAWTIRLSFTLEGLGQVNTRISLAGDKVSTIFWLENQQTATLFRKHLGELQNSLTRAGINIDQLSCLNGNPPETEESFFPQSLLHEKA